MLDQLKDELPGQGHQQGVFLHADLDEAKRIAGRVSELYIPSVRYVLKLQRFERRPPDGHKKQAAYDLLIEALGNVTEKLRSLAPIDIGKE